MKVISESLSLAVWEENNRKLWNKNARWVVRVFKLPPPNLDPQALKVIGFTKVKVPQLEKMEKGI